MLPLGWYFGGASLAVLALLVGTILVLYGYFPNWFTRKVVLTVSGVLIAVILAMGGWFAGRYYQPIQQITPSKAPPPTLEGSQQPTPEVKALEKKPPARKAESKTDGQELANTKKQTDKKTDNTTAQAQPAPTVPLIQNAPSGINIGPGATAPNPQVFNYAPPPAQLRFTEEVLTPLSPGGEKLMTVHVFTDRSIAGAVIGLVFSGR